jgi:hypothetical protein
VGAVSVVVVVVELVVTGGATTTGAGTTATGAGAGIVSTIGAGAVSSTVLWYEHPVTIPAATMAAGIIAIFLINRIVVTSIGYIPGDQQEAGQLRFCRICRGKKR